MRHRGSSKIKSQHHFIDGLEEYLREIQNWPEIKSIITGRIKPCRLGGKVTISVQYETKSGLKCLAHSHGAVQELFFVSSNPKVLAQKLSVNKK